MISESKLTNAMVEAFVGGAVYTSGKRAGEVKEQDVLWEGGKGALTGFGVRYAMRSRTWTYFLQWRVKGSNQERTIKIGRHNDPWRVDQARAKALELKSQMIGNGVVGVDPIAVRDEQRRQAARSKASKMTWKQLLAHFIENHRKKNGARLRPATERDYKRHVEKNMAEWLDRPVVDITSEMYDKKFDEITKRGAPIQANIWRSYVRSCLNHFRKHHKGAMPTNPVTEMVTTRNEEKARKTRVPIEHVGAVWNMLRERAKDERHRTACDWACFLILTGARSRESSELLWSNVSFERKTIRFPAEDTKTNEELELPLSDLLIELLEARKPDPAVGYVFATTSKTGHIGPDVVNSTWAAISKIAGCDVNRHDLRRTFVDVCDECDIDGDRQRMLVNHKSGLDVHSKHYRNSRRKLPEAVAAIAAWVQREAEVAANANVVPLRRTAQAG